MELSENDRKFIVTRKKTKTIDPVWVRFEVVEWDAQKRGRTLTAELTHSADREDAEQLIAQWCENNQAKLDGKTTIRPDLDTVKRSVDRH